MLKALILIDFQANILVFVEPLPLPDVCRNLHSFLINKIGFSKLKVNERSEHEFNGVTLFCLKLSEKHLCGCLIDDENPKKRLVFRLLETVYDKALSVNNGVIDKSTLNDRPQFRKEVQKEISDFQNGRGDITQKISVLQNRISSKAQVQINKELKKMDDLMEVKTEVEETEIKAEENAQNAELIKREAFLLSAKLWLLVYGSSILIAVLAIFLFFKFFV